MKNFTINNLLIVVIALFTGANALAADQVCNQFDYFYADITTSNGAKQTDIYSVSFVGSDAILTAISDIPYGAHIAYNDIEKLLYVVNEDDGSIQTYDPSTNDWSVVISAEEALNHITGASISQDGKLLLANQADGVIYIANFSTDPYTVIVYEPGNNISGGDLVFTNTGLYLASKAGGYFYVVLPGMPNDLIGQVDNKVTGLAKAEDGETVMLSAQGNTSFLQYDISSGVSQINEYNALLNGEPFTLGNGDMASGCSSPGLIIEECSNYKLYYMHHPQGGGDKPLMEVTLNNDGTASYNIIVPNFGGHIGITPDGTTIYATSSNKLRTFEVSSASITANVVIKDAGGTALGGFVAMVVSQDGTIYAVQSSSDQVFTIDPITGVATPFGPSRLVSGGDLVELDGEIWLINRQYNSFTNVLTGDSFTVPVDQINGAAVLGNGNVLVADGNGESLMKEIDPVTHEVVATYDIGFPLNGGDLAGVCVGNDPVIDCSNYKLYFMHHPLGGGQAPLMEVTLNNDGTASYTTLIPSLWGHIGISPDGKTIYAVNGTKMRIIDVATTSITQVVQLTDVGGASMSGFASLLMSADGTIYAGQSSSDQVYTIDLTTGIATPFGPSRPVSGGDIIELEGEIWLVNRQYNSFTNVLTGDSFTVPVTQMLGAAVLGNGNVLVADGNGGSLMKEIDPTTHEVVGTYDIGFPLKGGDLAGVCVNEDWVAVTPPTNPFIAVGSNSTITTYPNPTKGPSKVVFTTGVTTNTLVDVYDMNGRNVATLFNQETQKGKEYTVDFNGSNLPNGVYIYRMTTNNETVIEKFMIAR